MSAAGRLLSLLALASLAACGGAADGDLTSSRAALSADSNLLANGDFESGLSGWTASGSTSTSRDAHGGAGAALVGQTAPSGDSSLSQTVTLPQGGAQLTVWYKVHCPDTVDYDWASVLVLGSDGSLLATALASTCSDDGQWHQAFADLSSLGGQQVTIVLGNHDDGNPGDVTTTLFDDLLLTPNGDGGGTGGGGGGGTGGGTPGGCQSHLDCQNGQLCSAGSCVESACDSRGAGKTGVRITVKITSYRGIQHGRNGDHEIAYGTITNTDWVYDPGVIDTSSVQLAMNVASSVDPAGLPQEIPLSVGESILLEGEYISAATANASGRAVIHFSHSTCGFVDIADQIYQ